MKLAATQAVAATVAVVVAMALISGCESNHKCETAAPPVVTLKTETVDMMLAEAPTQMAVEQAILRQHTLYPYHFVQYSTALNELGERDLQILASHYRQYPGPLNVRQDDTPDALYQARIASVRNALQSAGVDVQQVQIADAAPGGDGVTGDRAVIIQRQPTQPEGRGRTVSVGNVTFQGNSQ